MANSKQWDFTISIFVFIVFLESVSCVSYSEFGAMIRKDRSIDLLELENMFDTLNRIQRSSDGIESLKNSNKSNIENDMLFYMEDFLDSEKHKTGSSNLRNESNSKSDDYVGEARAADDVFFKRVTDYVQTHVLNTKISETGRLFFKGQNLHIILGN